MPHRDEGNRWSELDDDRYSRRERHGPRDAYYGRDDERPYGGFRDDYVRGIPGAEMGGWYGAGATGYTEYSRQRAHRMRGFEGRGPRGYRRSDERIREDVNERLTWNAELDASDIEVGVQAGEVTLTGVVEDRHAKRLAEDLAEDVFGVNDVHNQLKVRHGFLAGLTGEKAEEREVPVTSVRDRGDATRREGRTTGARPSRT